MSLPISVRGAREHNLRAVDLDLPTGALVVLCGVSGSGKSSLAYDTLHVEGQRRYLEALAHARPGGPPLVPPRVDRIDGLPPTLALLQRAGAAGPRATVGSVTELDAVLRVLFARAGVAHCPVCGAPVRATTHDEIVGALMALGDARLVLEAPVRIRDPSALASSVLGEIERAGFSRVRLGTRILRIDEIDAGRVDLRAGLRIVVDRLRIEPDRRSRLVDSVRTTARVGRGVVIASTDADERVFVDRPYCPRDDLALPALEPRLLGTWGPPGACPTCAGAGLVDGARCGDCDGTRLSPAARAVRWRSWGFADLQARSLAELRADPIGSTPPVDEIERIALADVDRRLARAIRLGLGGIRPMDPVDTRSSSEIQRLRLVRQLASPLSGVLYVLDEPTAGLDPTLTEAVIEVMRELVRAGNTVVAVEHAPSVIAAADHVVEFGPGAGAAGGRVVFEGPPAGLVHADTPTGRWLSGRESIAPRSRPTTGEVTVSGAWLHGRAAATVTLPRGVVAALTGPAASGKSSLLDAVGAALSGKGSPAVTVDGAEGLTRPIVADRSAGRSTRSTPATYVGLWDVLRDLLASTPDAAIRALPAAAFSLTTPGGRCEACKGTGERVVELGPLPDVVQVCPVCEGRRFQLDVLEVRWKGLDASELLALSADEAHPILAGHPRLEEGLRALVRVGLGYVPLGQGVHALSGGEARRLVLARELARAHRRGAEDTVYLLDDPSVGLHPRDTATLVQLLRELTDEGATVWVATVDPKLVDAADRIVRLGACG